MIMKKKTYEGYTYVDGGVCAAKGFVANGINCGLNSDKNKNDLGMVYSSTVCNAAAVYTQNKVKGAPILVTKEHLKATGGKAMAVSLIQRMQIPVMLMAWKRQSGSVSWQQMHWESMQI